MAHRRCSRTGKEMFPNKVEADIALAFHQLKSKKHNRQRHLREEPIRSYKCEFCHRWHLTSQPERGTLTS